MTHNFERYLAVAAAAFRLKRTSLFRITFERLAEPASSVGA